MSISENHNQVMYVEALIPMGSLSECFLSIVNGEGQVIGIKPAED